MRKTVIAAVAMKVGTATSDRTRELLDCTPTGPTLSEDLAAGAYGTAVRA